MWNALENMALRESLPTPLQAGDSVHDILVKGQVPGGRYRIHHLGYRRSSPYLLKQYYSLDTDAFLRWQNEARFIPLTPGDGFVWPMEEWRGGLITLHPGGLPLMRWLGETHRSMRSRLAVMSRIAGRIATLHASGIVHRRLTPGSVQVTGSGATIADFGHARHEGWDDLWVDSLRAPCDASFACPEVLNGDDGNYAEDIYGMGLLLHLLLTGKPAFGPVKRHLRRYLPGFIRPEEFPGTQDVPRSVGNLAQACLAPNGRDRPGANDVANVLEEFSDIPQRHDLRITVPGPLSGDRPKERVMVFVKDDHRAVGLFDRALELASTPSLFLFVGLVPGNLPSGHLERFKGRLFNKLAQGLSRCRAAGVQWSLRVLENVSPEIAANHLIEAYGPDRILLGRGTARRCFSTRLATLDSAVERIP